MTDKHAHRLRSAGILLLVAFALQTYHVARQSLWYDEGFSAYLSTHSLSQITVRTAADIHPPLYYYLLHGWQLLGGNTEFSLRFLSVFFGVLCVALAYALGTRLFDRQTGVIVAGMTAVSPLYLWYAREARMYTLVTALGMASSYLLLRMVDGDRRRVVWAGYALSLTAGIYAHFYAWFLFAFHVGYALLSVRRKSPLSWRKRLCHTGAAQLVVLLAFLPWSSFVWVRFGADVSYWPGTLSFARVLSDTLIAFATGHTVAAPLAGKIAVGYLLLFVIATIFIGYAKTDDTSSPGDKRPDLLFLLAYLIVPIVLVYAISYSRPKWHPRYLMLASPPFLLTLAAGITTAARKLWFGLQPQPAKGYIMGKGIAILAAAFLIVTTIYADVNLYHDPRFTKDDWRSVATYVSRHKQQDETVLLLSGHTFPVFSYYYPDHDWVPLPNEPTLSTRHVLGYAVANDLNRALDRKRGAWLVLWEENVVDPNEIVPLMLAGAGQEEVVPRSFWGIGLRHFRFPPAVHLAAEPPIQHPRQVNFGQKLQLLGYRVPDSPSPADQGVEITLFWQAQQRLEKDYRLALRVRDGDGFLWGNLDRRPAAYFYPTGRWAADKAVPGHYVIPLLTGTPPGRYWIEVGVYANGHQEALDVLDSAGAAQGKTVRLGPVLVGRPEHPPDSTTLGLSSQANEPFGANLTFLGSTLPAGDVLPGEAVVVTWAWQVRQSLDADVQLRLRWKGRAGHVDNVVMLPPGTKDFAAETWRNGDIVRSQHRLIVPRDAGAGSLTLLGMLVDGEGNPLSEETALGDLQVTNISHHFEPPVVVHEQVATFGNSIRLLGTAGIPATIRPGQSLPVTLYWQAMKPVNRSYTRFVHLLDERGKVWSQQDREPVGGQRPTTSWLAGEYLTDTVTLSLPDGALAGVYRLEVGFYDSTRPDMPRLPVQNESGVSTGDHLLLEDKIVVK